VLTSISRLDTQGLGMSTLPLRPSLDACGESTGWYYVFSDPNHLEITLCPASCDEQQAGTFGFVLHRFGCPVT
jgi:hypothetical protein